MPTEKKKQIVSEFQDALSRCSVGILTDYRGLNVAQITELRRKLRAANMEYRVIKNSLAQIAAKNIGKEILVDKFTGPMAVALGYGEITEATKLLTEYIKNSKINMAIKGAFFDDTFIDEKGVDRLAKLPPKEVLIAQVLGGIQSPLYGIVNVLAGPIRGIMGVLNARMKQMEEM